MRLSLSAERRLVVGATALFGLFWLLIILFPGSRESREGTTRIVWVNTAWSGLFYSVAVSGLVAFALSIWGTCRKCSPGWLPWALGIVGPFVTIPTTLITELGSFVDAASVRDADGTEYHLLESSFLQGSELALGRLMGRFAFEERFVVLVNSPWEESFGYLAVVRPQRHDKESPLLVLTKGGVIVGLPYENRAFLAYDPGAGKAYSQIFNGNEAGYTDLRHLSPFLLLGVGDIPRSDDFRALMNRESFGRPYPEAVMPGTKSFNPRVAIMARMLLADLRTRPPRP